MTRLRFLPLVLASLGLPSPMGGQAETRPVATVGARVRATSPRLPSRVVGTVVSIGDGGLVLERATGAAGERRLRLEPADLTRLEISRGSKSHWLTGGLVGLASGAALGIAVWQSAKEADDDSFANAYLTAGGALLGALAGAGVGSLVKTERWEAVDVGRLALEISLRPQPGHAPAIRIGLQLRP